MDCSLPGSSVHGIFQARILGWVKWRPRAFSRFSTGDSDIVSSCDMNDEHHFQNKSEYHRAEKKRKSHQTKINSQQILCYLFLSMKITISPWTKFVFTQLCPSTNIGKYPPITQSEAATENTQRKASFCLKTSMATLNSLKHVAMSGTT